VAACTGVTANTEAEIENEATSINKFERIKNLYNNEDDEYGCCPHSPKA
jgi:hypothetical protein